MFVENINKGGIDCLRATRQRFEWRVLEGAVQSLRFMLRYLHQLINK